MTRLQQELDKCREALAKHTYPGWNREGGPIMAAITPIITALVEEIEHYQLRRKFYAEKAEEQKSLDIQAVIREGKALLEIDRLTEENTRLWGERKTDED